MAKHDVKRRLLITTTILGIFFVGIFVGRVWGIQQDITSDGGAVDITKVVNLYATSRSSEVEFDQFWKVWDRVKEKHVSQPVNEVDLFYGAIQGMVDGLDDPYSVYLPPKKAEEFASDLSGEFEGIGAEVGKKDDVLTIIAPLPGSPAEKAGLKAGDKIFAIDAEEAYSKTIEEAITKIRGKKGTPVTLTIVRQGIQGTKDYQIIRDKINVPTVIWEMKEDAIAYLRVLYFNEHTWKEFDTAVKAIQKEKPSGLILDLRSNPGGYLDTSVQVASEWVPSGQVVVKEIFNNGKKNEYKSQGKYRFANMKTVVLVDGGTASGAEIVAGALQDYDLATIIGQKTYGKGSVQDFEILPDGSALKLTVAKWFTPEEQVIDKQGVVPDVVVPAPTDEEIEAKKDIVLEKGIQLLKE